MIKGTLRRSIWRAQVHKLIGQNVIELIDLPSGQPGRPFKGDDAGAGRAGPQGDPRPGNGLRQGRLRPGELRKLTWDHVDLNRGVIHVWKSASKSGDTKKTPGSKRSLELPKRAIAALAAHQKRQAKEREAAGATWHDDNLVFCHENGDAVI
jgi:integrase